jgi:hypothetical protein
MFAGLSARLSLFLHVQSHAQVEYYLNIADARRAANESMRSSPGPEGAGAKIIEIHPPSRHSRG